MALPRSILLPLVAGMALALSPCAPAAPATAVDLSGTTDDSFREVVRRVAHHQVRPIAEHGYPAVATLDEARAAIPDGIDWNYPWGVTLYGVIRSTDATGDTAARDFVLEHNRVVARTYAWLEGLRPKFSEDAWTAFLREYRRVRISGLLRLGNLDNCGAMGAECLEGALRYPDQVTADERAVFARVADWITHQQARLPDGTFWRPTAKDDTKQWPEGTIWADDLYMSCPFLVRWSAYTKDDRYLTDAAHQVIAMARRLQDKDGVWFHAYSVPKQEHSPYKWGRANGWILVTTAEILSALPENHPDRAALLDIFRRQVAGLKALQDKSGMWHQVLDHPELWEETSCTAMFSYAIARGVNRGWLPTSDLAVARRGFAAICQRFVTPDGAVNGTCQGTGIGLTLPFYGDRKRPDDDLHGRGVVLLAGTEILSAKK